MSTTHPSQEPFSGGAFLEYLDGLVPPRSDELTAMEAYARQVSFPIVGAASGYFCYLIARLIGARRVFELGSGFGYSTAWFARAVRENGDGQVYHVVWDEDLSAQARDHLAALGYADLMQYRVGEAIQTLRATEGPFDLIFNDIDKQGYPASLPAIAEKLRPGGALIVDNMLYHARIFDPTDQTAATNGVRELTRLVTTDPGWIASIVPIRDGLLLAFKK
ncbi:MAG TPA: O-methyltransferase [Anaerolineaceae bacterium]|jgi:predicted O-methyltransferase YrrM